MKSLDQFLKLFKRKPKPEVVPNWRPERPPPAPPPRPRMTHDFYVNPRPDPEIMTVRNDKDHTVEFVVRTADGYHHRLSSMTFEEYAGLKRK